MGGIITEIKSINLASPLGDGIPFTELDDHAIFILDGELRIKCDHVFSRPLPEWYKIRDRVQHDRPYDLIVHPVNIGLTLEPIHERDSDRTHRACSLDYEKLLESTFAVPQDVELDLPDSPVNDGAVIFTDGKKSELYFREDTRVWIGDPCYVPFFNDNWDAFLDVYFDVYTDDGPSHVMACNGIPFVLGNTAHGDGTYHLNVGGSCGVDAGLLSVVPAGEFGLVEKDGEDYGGEFVTVKGYCKIDENHTLHAGSVRIHTGDECKFCTSLESECDCRECFGCGEEEDFCECCDSCGLGPNECECE